jgi:signal transduction histidine kinase
VTRAEQGRLVGPKQLVDLTELIQEVCEPRESPHRFIVCVNPPVLGRFDRVRLKQLLSNLIENAIKYSPLGGDIEVRAYQTEAFVGVDVTDHGIGVPADNLPRIFDCLQRGSNVDDRRFVGMGLGLFICRAIVEEHGGRIWATSPGLNLGTTIHLELRSIGE